ncbi:MAG: hypothetical protein BWY51_00151 [Parcubacteria group bacterium ADurb.Bin316]|nr:MAG: hypothetical protein BWY51_00151 [Parcubacteria group bacterium ADurb.Bin316]HOZ55756.1 hypothetical protein [bacterium]
MIKSLKLVIVIILSAVIGAGVFSFVLAEKLYFPEIKEVANDAAAGLWLKAYQYNPWLWNKEKITIINIHDRKNDAPNTEYKLKGEVGSIRLIHSGEDFALIAYSDPNFSSMESGYVVHRSPKSESENTIEEIHIGGNIIAVAPDESGYFYISGNEIFKRSWQGETIISADLEMSLEPILGVQLISVGMRPGYQPILFFGNNKKLAFWGTPLGERDGYLFIWDLENNKIEKIFRQDLGNYNDLRVEDDKLYIERMDSSLSKKLITE